jgi:hypothetical protein|tara:strand:- start:79 stop:312 length:234 start_codon:yes stop_codon:yes gene_type:complete
MNATNHKDLTTSVNLVDKAVTIIEDVAILERESLEKMPEHLTESDAYMNMDETVSDLEDIQGDLEEIATRIFDVINK